MRTLALIVANYEDFDRIRGFEEERADAVVLLLDSDPSKCVVWKSRHTPCDRSVVLLTEQVLFLLTMWSAKMLEERDAHLSSRLCDLNSPGWR